MPSAAEHLAQVDRNRQAREHLAGHGGFPEWVAVTAFYEALHLVESLFAQGNEPRCVTHAEREQYMKRHPQWSRTIFPAYKKHL